MNCGNPWVGKPRWPTLTVGVYYNGRCIKMLLAEAVLYLGSYDLTASVCIAIYMAIDVFVKYSPHA